MPESIKGTVCCPRCTAPIHITFNDGLLMASSHIIINDLDPELLLNPSDLGIEDEAKSARIFRPDSLSKGTDA